MSTYSKHVLSESVGGAGILVTTSPTNLHATATGGGSEEIWMYATNSSTSDLMLTVSLSSDGGTSYSTIFNGVIEAYAGSVLIIPGLCFGENLPVEGFVSFVAESPSSASLEIFGYANRITNVV